MRVAVSSRCGWPGYWQCRATVPPNLEVALGGKGDVLSRSSGCLGPFSSRCCQAPSACGRRGTEPGFLRQPQLMVPLPIAPPLSWPLSALALCERSRPGDSPPGGGGWPRTKFPFSVKNSRELRLLIRSVVTRPTTKSRAFFVGMCETNRTSRDGTRLQSTGKSRHLTPCPDRTVSNAVFHSVSGKRLLTSGVVRIVPSPSSSIARFHVPWW